MITLESLSENTFLSGAAIAICSSATICSHQDNEGLVVQLNTSQLI